MFAIKVSNTVFARGTARKASTASSKRAASSASSKRAASSSSSKRAMSMSSSKARVISGSTSPSSSSNTDVATDNVVTNTNVGGVDAGTSKLLDNLIMNDVKIINGLNDVNNKLKEVISSIRDMSLRIASLEKSLNSGNASGYVKYPVNTPSSSNNVRYPVPVMQYGGCAYSTFISNNGVVSSSTSTSKTTTTTNKR